MAALAAARGERFSDQMLAAAADWHGFLARTRLPASADQQVVSVAKRSLITTRLAIDPDSGAIVASADTQGPYGEDWIRDGSFINQLLDANGYSDIVTRHDLFYAAVQTSPQNPSPVRAFGNWAMNSYGDGVDGAPIPYEIDETGLGAWTLYAHSAALTGAARQAYLRAVYPAIARAAEYMTACVDPTSGLQCLANEDDNPTPSQSLHGAETVYLGLQSAIAAAAALNQSSAEVAAWRARLTSLGRAIAALYDPAAGAYREGNTQGNAYNLDYGDGGWLLWPVAFKPYSDPAMQHEADAVAAAMNKSLAGPHGEYEGKALLALAHAWSQPTPAQRRELQATLAYMASTLTTSTGLFGEAWQRFAGHPVAVEDMPHVWEHALFYLAAVAIDGAQSYRFQAGDLYARACETQTAPASACPPAPVISAFSMTHRRFHAGPHASAFRFTLSQAAAVKITVTRLRRRAPGVLMGALLADEPGGMHLLSLGARIGGRRLRPGLYRASITARSPGAPAAVPRQARFVVVGPAAGRRHRAAPASAAL